MCRHECADGIVTPISSFGEVSEKSRELFERYRVQFSNGPIINSVVVCHNMRDWTRKLSVLKTDVYELPKDAMEQRGYNRAKGRKVFLCLDNGYGRCKGFTSTKPERMRDES